MANFNLNDNKIQNGKICSSSIDRISVYYRPQTKFAKVMFSQEFVCPRGDLHRGLCLGVVSASGGGWADHPQVKWNTVNKRAVRILLERILV